VPSRLCARGASFLNGFPSGEVVGSLSGGRFSGAQNRAQPGNNRGLGPMMLRRSGEGDHGVRGLRWGE
jgi:hypothetical protein